MKWILNTSLIIFFISCNLLISQNNTNPNPFFEFLKNEKMRNKIDKAIEIYNKSQNQLKDASLPSPILMGNEDELTVSNDKSPESEIHAAIDPTNPKSMVISAIRQSVSGGDLVTCPVYYTINGGKNWNKSTFITKPITNLAMMLFGGGDPVLVFDKFGTLHFSWINLYVYKGQNSWNWDYICAGMFYATSTNGGKTFQFSNDYHLEKIFTSIYDKTSNLNELLDKQWMAASPVDGSVYLSCVHINQKMTNKPIIPKIFKKSPNAVKFDSVGTQIKLENLYIAQFGSIDVDLQDKVHYVFFSTNGSYQDLYHCISKDKGKTFSYPYRITSLMGSMSGLPNAQTPVGVSTDRLYPSPYMVVDKSNSKFRNNIYLTFTASGITKNNGKGLDIYFTKSTDGGRIWSTPKVVNNDDKPNIHNFYSNIAVNESGVIAITYYDKRNYTESNQSGFTDFYLSLSYDGGETFSDYKISSSPSDFSMIGKKNSNFGIGEYNAIMMSKDYVFPVWADGRTNDGDINIYVSKFRINQDSLPGLIDINSVSGSVTIENIYPNPASDRISISFTSKIKDRAIVEIYDITGKKLKSLEIVDVNIGTNSIDFNISELSNAAYFAKVTVGNVYSVLQFQKVE